MNLHRPLLLFTLAGLLFSRAAAGQPVPPFSFDASLPANAPRTQQNLDTLNNRIPDWVSLPGFQSLPSGPDGATSPTVTLWFMPEMKAQYERTLQASNAPPMEWPAPAICVSAAGLELPLGTLLKPGASAACVDSDANLRAVLTAATVDACRNLEAPERYVLASRAPSGASESARADFANARTNTLEQQIALVGAGLGEKAPPVGLLPDGWVATLRSVLWKIRPQPTAQTAAARTALQEAVNLLTQRAYCFDDAAGPALRTRTQGMLSELNAMEAQVNQVLAAGTARAAEQSQCLATRGRTRPANLPYPALTDEEREFISFWLGGLYWRLRGGGYLVLGSTQKNRTYYTRRVFKELARLSNGQQDADKAAEAVFCNLFDGWGSWFDMGTYMNASAPPEDNQDTYDDLVLMTNRGRQHVADFPVEAYSCWVQGVPTSVNKSPEEYLRDSGFDTLPVWGAGLDFGPCYLYALNPLKNFTYFSGAEVPSPYSSLFEGFTSLGEFCVGASLGLGFTRSLLNGTPSGQPTGNLCGARVCGQDSCGNPCGTCGANENCTPEGTCAAATPASSSQGASSVAVEGSSSAGASSTATSAQASSSASSSESVSLPVSSSAGGASDSLSSSFASGSAAPSSRVASGSGPAVSNAGSSSTASNTGTSGPGTASSGGLGVSGVSGGEDASSGDSAPGGCAHTQPGQGSGSVAGALVVLWLARMHRFRRRVRTGSGRG